MVQVCSMVFCTESVWWLRPVRLTRAGHFVTWLQLCLTWFSCNSNFFNWPSACGKLLLLCLSLYSATRVPWLTNDIIQRNPGPMWWWRPWRVEIQEARGDAQAQGAAGAVSDSAVVMQRNADYLSWTKLALKNKMIVPSIHKGYRVVNLDVTWSCKLMKEQCLKKLANVYLINLPWAHPRVRREEETIGMNILRLPAKDQWWWQLS